MACIKSIAAYLRIRLDQKQIFTQYFKKHYISLLTGCDKSLIKQAAEYIAGTIPKTEIAHYRELKKSGWEQYIISCGTYGTTGKGKIYREHNPYNKFKNIDKQQERMKNTTILNQDYKTVIKKYDSSKTFFFLDPPYERSKDLYKEGTFNYEELNNILENVKGKFLLTLNDSSNIRTIFRNFNIKRIKVKGNRRGREGGLGGGTRNELIITNYL